MANQRDKDKRYVSAWIPSRLNAELIALARQRGIAKSDLVNQLLAAEAERHPSNSAKIAAVADKAEAAAIDSVRTDRKRGSGNLRRGVQVRQQ